VAQVVECLPSKSEAMSSNPGTAKKDKLTEAVCTPLIPTLRKLRPDHEFMASYTASK
jgi:hypothetical protein